MVDPDANTTHDVLVILRVADKYLVEGKTENAEELFNRALRHDPTNIHARAGLARCQMEGGALAQAKHTLAQATTDAQSEAPIAAVEKLIALFELTSQGVKPSDLDVILTSGDRCLVEGNSTQAEELFERALDIDPANIHACAGLARCQIESGEITKAKHTIAEVPNTGQDIAAISAVRRLIALIESRVGDVLENATESIETKLRMEHIARINALARKERSTGTWLHIGRQA